MLVTRPVWTSSSLIESVGAELKAFEIGNLGDHGGRHHHHHGGQDRLGVPGLLPDSSVTSRGSSQADLLECSASLASTDSHGPKSPLLPGSRELLEVFGVVKPNQGVGGPSMSGVPAGAGVHPPVSEAGSSGSGTSGRRCVSVNDIRFATPLHRTFSGIIFWQRQ